MALKVFWTKRANRKYNAIIDYLNEVWGERVAQSFVRKVNRFIEIAVEVLTIGTMENLKHGIRGFVIVKTTYTFLQSEREQIYHSQFLR